MNQLTELFIAAARNYKQKMAVRTFKSTKSSRLYRVLNPERIEYPAYERQKILRRPDPNFYFSMRLRKWYRNYGKRHET